MRRVQAHACACSPVWSKNSCGFTRVVFQKPPEPFATLHRALTLCVLADGRKEQHVALTLVIPLIMIMCHILRQRMAERRFSKEDEPRPAFLLDGSHPPLRVGVEMRRPWRQRHSLDSGRVDDLLKSGAIFPVSVMDQVLPGREDAPLLHRDVARHLHHPSFIGMRCHPCDLDLPNPAMTDSVG